METTNNPILSETEKELIRAKLVSVASDKSKSLAVRLAALVAESLLPKSEK